MSFSGISSGFVLRALLTKVGEIILNSSNLCPWTFRKFNPRAWGYYGILVTIETQLHQTRNDTCIANYMKGWCHKIWPRTIYFIDISCWTMGDCSPCLPTDGDRDKPTVNLFNLNLRFDSYYYTPRTTKLLGGIWVSLRPSVRPSRIPCPLCNFNSSGWIHFIFIHLIKQLQKVCRVQSFLQNLKIWSFGSILKFVTLTLCCFDLGSDVNH